MFKVLASAPTRVDLGGGTLDITPLHHLLEHKATVNFSVSLTASVTLEPSSDGRFEVLSEDQGVKVRGTWDEVRTQTELPLFGLLLSSGWSPDLPALRITTKAKSPAGAGLGGSSCIGIAFAGALTHLRAKLTNESSRRGRDLVQQVQDVETRVIRAPTGCQDYWGALNGGLNIIRYAPGGIQVTNVPLAKVKGVGTGLILCFSGKSRASAANNWQIFRRAFDGDTHVLRTLNRIGLTAEALADAVMRGDLAGIFKASRDEWSLRKELWADIETPETKGIEQAALNAGAAFARVCGAGGGGVMAIFVPDGDKTGVEAAVRRAGGTVLDGKATDTGLEVRDA